MLKPTAVLLVTILLSLGMISCGEEEEEEEATPETFSGPEYDPALASYLKTNYGLVIGDLTEEENVFTVKEDGDIITSATISISLEGRGVRELYLEEVLSSTAEGGGVQLYLEDVESEETRFFDYNITDNYITFGQDWQDDATGGWQESGAAVSRREDGKYVVWTFDDSEGSIENETIVDNGYEALKLVDEYSEFSTIDPHIMMAAIALGHTEIPEARIPRICGQTGVAARPPVCSLFKEFCECAACDALGRTGGSCALCPDL